MGKIDTGFNPREFLGNKLYESAYAPMNEEEVSRIMETFAKSAANDSLTYKKAQDIEGADAALARAERFRSLAHAEEISEESWNEFSPWLEHAIERAEKEWHEATHQLAKKSATKKVTDLKRLQDFFAKKRKKAA